MIGKRLRIGSRESKLAVIQAQMVIALLKQAWPDLDIELVTMKTTGDRIQDRRLEQVGGKGLFVKELDQALREGRIDLSVHSLKDMPMETPEDLPLLAYTPREDPRDILIYKPGITEASLREGGCIGTSSRRRELQLRKRYPRCEFRSIRGNVQTRLVKLETQEYAATVLAAAGIRRLHMDSVIGRYCSVDEIIPAAGQGIIAVQGRKGENARLLSRIDCAASRIAAEAERAFVRELGGGCSSPIAAYAQVQGDQLILSGLYAEEGSFDYLSSTIEGSAVKADQLGQRLAQILKG